MIVDGLYYWFSRILFSKKSFNTFIIILFTSDHTFKSKPLMITEKKKKKKRKYDIIKDAV